jgi:competence protein ComEA
LPREMHLLGFLKKEAARSDSDLEVCRRKQERRRQKGLFIVTLLVLAGLGLYHAAPGGREDRTGDLPEGKNPVTIQVSGLVARPGLLTYAHPPTVREVLGDAGVESRARVIPLDADREILDRDLTLTVQGLEKGAFQLDRRDLSLKALWILGRPLPLNRATAEDLSRLPGIGPKMAERIVLLREALGGFRSLEQLKEVKGIKEKTFAKIKGHFIL